MKRKFPFLLEYSDEFIRDTGIHILKAETLSHKLQDMDRSKKAEDKLSTFMVSALTLTQ